MWNTTVLDHTDGFAISAPSTAVRLSSTGYRIVISLSAMRLTLRTMLAYMDDVLDPADADAIRAKIEESDFASGLADRIQGALKKLRMDAPKLDGKGMGNDANTVSEYLDSALTQDFLLNNIEYVLARA